MRNIATQEKSVEKVMYWNNLCNSALDFAHIPYEEILSSVARDFKGSVVNTMLSTEKCDDQSFFYIELLLDKVCSKYEVTKYMIFTFLIYMARDRHSDKYQGMELPEFLKNIDFIAIGEILLGNLQESMRCTCCDVIMFATRYLTSCSTMLCKDFEYVGISKYIERCLNSREHCLNVFKNDVASGYIDAQVLKKMLKKGDFACSESLQKFVEEYLAK